MTPKIQCTATELMNAANSIAANGLTSGTSNWASAVFKQLPPAPPSKYMVSVTGSQAPTKVHDDMDAARLEAERLVTQPNNRDRTIHVVQIVATIKPQTTHVWEVAA